MGFAECGKADVAGRPPEVAAANEESNDGREQRRSSNEPWPVWLPAPPSIPPSTWLTLSHTPSQSRRLCPPKKRVMFGSSGGSRVCILSFFYWSFPELGARWLPRRVLRSPPPLQQRPHSVCSVSRWGCRHFPGITLLAQQLQWADGDV